MSNLSRHVTAITCDLVPCDRTPFREVLHDQVESQGNSDRMACRPENFTKAGFFFSCRTPNDIKSLHGLRGTEQVWPTVAHCKPLAYLTGGDVIRARVTGSRVKGVTGESLAGRLASVKLAATITGFAWKASGFSE